MSSGKVLLIVDDSRVARLMLRTYIGALRPKWRIVEAENAEAAMAATTQHPPDYATLDYSMPGMNGIELAERLASQLPNLKMVLITANIQTPVQQRSAALGMELVAKPITEKSCAQIVEILGD